MGYIPWGHKELETTERLSTAQRFDREELLGKKIKIQSLCNIRGYPIYKGIYAKIQYNPGKTIKMEVYAIIVGSNSTILEIL